jgi:hypothetical protein
MIIEFSFMISKLLVGLIIFYFLPSLNNRDKIYNFNLYFLALAYCFGFCIYFLKVSLKMIYTSFIVDIIYYPYILYILYNNTIYSNQTRDIYLYILTIYVVYFYIFTIKFIFIRFNEIEYTAIN